MQPTNSIYRIGDITPKQSTFSAKELIERKLEKIPCLVDPIFPKVGVCAIGGASDTGKSSFLRQLAINIAIGNNDFLGFELKPEHQKAIYVSTEDDDRAISFLLNQHSKHSNLESICYEGLTFIFQTYDLINTLEKILSKNPVDLIVIDAFTDLYGKSMNDSNQVRTFLNKYSQLAQKYECLIIFLHHTGKRTEQYVPSKHNLLGSQGFEAKMRLVIEIRSDNYEPNKRHLCIVKGNYLSAEYKSKSYVLLFDENLNFEITNERIPFERLTSSNKSDLRKKVIEFKAKGKTQVEIAKTLNVSQTTVSRHLNE